MSRVLKRLFGLDSAFATSKLMRPSSGLRPSLSAIVRPHDLLGGRLHIAPQHEDVGLVGENHGAQYAIPLLVVESYQGVRVLQRPGAAIS